VKTLIGFALGTMLSFGAVGAASAAGMGVAAPAAFPAGIEVIVVTAKRPAAPAPVAAEPIYEVIVTGKRAPSTDAARTAPTTAIEMPKVELAVGGPPVVRL